MTINTIAHINLQGNARQALEFYHAVFGGHSTMVTYAQAGDTSNEADADRLIWGQVVGETGFRVMAHDVSSGKAWNPGENAYFIVVEADSVEEINRRWDKLSDGAVIVQALAPSPWSPLYGMLTDRFGVTWVLSVASPSSVA